MSRRALVLAVTLTVALVVGPVGFAAAQSGGMVTVTVALQDSNGDPVGDADLDVTWDGGSTTATTAGNGKAFVDVPAGAEVTVEMSHPRYVRTDPYVIEDASEREVTIDVFRKSSIRLEVSDDDGGVADASVLVERGGLDITTGSTDRNGVFETGVIPEGSYAITVSKPGYYDRTKTLRAEGNITNRVALRRGTTTVDVTVTDPYFETPRAVRNARVNLTGVGQAQTDRSGTASVTAPVNTRTTLRVTKDGYRTVERDVQIGAENASVAVDLSRTRTVTLEATNDRVVAGERTVVTATNAYGDGVPAAAVVLDGERVGTTNGEGEATVRIADPGDHTLRVEKDGVASNEVRIEAIDPDADSGESANPTATAGSSQTTAPPTTATATETGAASPGFAPGVAVVAIVLAGLRWRRR